MPKIVASSLFTQFLRPAAIYLRLLRELDIVTARKTLPRRKELPIVRVQQRTAAWTVRERCGATSKNALSNWRNCVCFCFLTFARPLSKLTAHSRIAMSIVLPPLATPLPLELKQLIDRRIEAESALAARETDADHVGGAGEALVDRAGDLLESLVRDSTEWLAKSGESPRKILARGRFVLAWSIGRLSEYDGKGEESLRLSLEHYEKTGELLHLPPPPALDSVPSVSRPRTSKDATVKLPMQDAFVGEILAEWSRIQATFAFAVLLGPAGKEDVLSDLIDLAARRNVQGSFSHFCIAKLWTDSSYAALFTPLNESTVNSDDGENEEAGTVIGNARLLEDMASMRDWSSEPQLWKRRIDWATHICDVSFPSSFLGMRC